MRKMLLCLLFCSTADAATVTLNWTAPGDDGDIGTCAEYDVRYAQTSITEATWAAAVQVPGEPVPSGAGSNETFSFPIVGNGTFFVAMKASDEVSNWSPLSNVVTVSIDTVAPSAIIIISGTVAP